MDNVIEVSNLIKNFDVSKGFFSRNSVDAGDLSELPFVGGTFKFSGKNVKLIHKRAVGDPSMRVNSRPVGPEVDLGEDVWLGVGGRLLTFRMHNGNTVDEVLTDSTDSVTGIGDVAPMSSPGD